MFERVEMTKKRIFVNNFIGGISWAVGVTVGLSLIFALLTLFSMYINLVPIVGSFISDIIDFILKTNQNFR